ncbi:DUF2489 domain-containing protein [Rheinheimera maricola]|uniref:DUF2489 domain-containing protein n=1 Tax=Rheinheimera maricola TaxID=2793282 RepID=A0ABS7XD80_9GAMM|nr:DUF2489 domain-containing protein [Rheinheimera maricola]MBZ9613124.1 DUF2489 domain-containing protein [Rheinheimera maricola]
MSSTTLSIMVAAALLVAGLAFYAGTLLWRLQQQTQAKQKKLNEKRQYLRDSITLICKAMREEQCELSEGALRVWVLLDHLVPERKPDPETTYPGLYQMYQVVKDMPTHQARKEQAKSLTLQQDELRLKAEQDLKQSILADAKALLLRFQPD